MRFVAQITVEVEADSFASAAEHEREITKLFQGLKANYPSCRLEIKQRRAPQAKTARVKTGRPRHTGNLATYGT
jgi:hypothetical protein